MELESKPGLKDAKGLEASIMFGNEGSFRSEEADVLCYVGIILHGSIRSHTRNAGPRGQCSFTRRSDERDRS